MNQPVAAIDRQTEPSSRPSKLSHWVRLRRPFGLSELAFALIALGIVAILALGPRLLHGGFHLDDWSNATTTLQPPNGSSFGSAVARFANFTISRPVLVVYVPLTYFVFGMHMHYHLALAAFLAVLAATLFYGVLRTLGLPWIHALLLAAMTIVFPWSDSTRLWVTADQETLSIVFLMAGLLIALLGLKRGTWRWHGWAAVLYLLSIFTYEVTLPIVACAGILYCLEVGWGAARTRWLADVTVAVAAGIWVGAHTSRTASGLGGDFEHLKQIVRAGGTILGRAGVPLGDPHTALVLCGLAAVLGVGLVCQLLFPDRFATESGWGLRGWLFLAFGGLLVAALGWAMFVPADPYYTPSIYGETNRVNGLAGFGLVLLVYGAFGILGSLISQGRPKAGVLATGVTVSLAVVLLASYTHVLRRHIEIWNLAFSAETYALTQTQHQLPHLPHGTTIFASAYPANQTPGVPILAATWDYNGMVEMEYDDGTLAAYPVLPERRVVCLADGVAIEREGVPEITAAYGTVRLLNLQTGGHSAPRSRRECRQIADAYVPGPLYLSPSY
jgi:uncharacterized membrane protein